MSEILSLPEGYVLVDWNYNTIVNMVLRDKGTVVKDTTGWTVSFDANGGTGSMEAETGVRGDYVLPECTFTPPEGKLFSFWSIDNIWNSPGTIYPVKEDTTLTAVWEDGCTITFDANGGVGSMEPVTGLIGAYTLPECGFLPPEGMVFQAWKINGAKYQPGEEYTVTWNTLAEAVWINDVYSVNFDADGGTGEMEPIEGVEWFEWVLVPECGFTPPEGMQFKCWTVKGVPEAEGKELSPGMYERLADKTLMAVWEPIPEEPVVLVEGSAGSGRYFTDLSAGFDYAAGLQNPVITILSDLEISQMIEVTFHDADQQITVNLNGKNITINGTIGWEISREGNLTFQGPGMVTSDSRAIMRVQFTTVNINGGEYTGSSHLFDAQIGSHLIINDGTFHAGSGAFNSIVNMLFDASATINGGDFWGTFGVWSETDTRISINGGSFHTKGEVVLNGYDNNIIELTGHPDPRGIRIVNGTNNETELKSFVLLNEPYELLEYETGEPLESLKGWGTAVVGIAHRFDSNGFCEEPGCGQYQPANMNENGCFEISNPGQFYWFAAYVNGDGTHAWLPESGTGVNTHPGAKAVLTADIDLQAGSAAEGRQWTAIGSEENPYTGIFDGGGHTISGLSITTGSSYQGLFGYCGAGSVVQNLRVSGSIMITGNASEIGGIVGYLKGGTVSGVVSNVTISNSGGEVKHVGGVAGALYDGARLSQVVNQGTVTTSGSNDCIAGVAGYMWDSTIEYSVNMGIVSASGSNAYAGGITGYSNTSRNSIRSSYNYGSVSSDSGTYCGAVIGWLRDAGTVLENCCYLEGSAGKGVGTNAGTANTWSVTAEAFAAGKAAWLLNGGSVAADGTVTDPSGSTWGQTLPGETLPVIGGAAVYRYETCGGEEGFTNDPGQAGKQEHQFDETYRCTACGLQLVVSVTAGEETDYYADIAEAFKAAGTAEGDVVVTLLADTVASETLTVPEGSSMSLRSGTDGEGNPYTLSGDVSAADSGLIDIRGGSFTLESGNVENGENGTNAIAVNGGNFVMTGGTVRAASDWNSAVCVYSGTADIRGGLISGNSSVGAYGAAAVGANSTVIVSGGTVSGSGNGAGIYVHSGGRAEVSGGSMTGGAYGLQTGSGSGILSGGTFTGTEAAVSIGSTAAETVKSLLADRKAYYEVNDDAKTLITDLAGKTLPAGTVAIEDCTHSCDTWTDEGDEEHHSGICVVCGTSVSEAHSWTWTDNGDGTHAKVCEDCGAKLENEPHSYESWTDNGDRRTHSRICVVCGYEDTENHSWDESGNCTACGAEGGYAASIAADGDTEYFFDINEAWAAAKAKNGAATVTLLRDVTASEPLKVEAGDEIILESRTFAGEWYCIYGAFGRCGIIQVEGGSFTMNGGGLSNSGRVDGNEFYYSYDLQVSSGRAVINNGEFIDSGYEEDYGMYITGGEVEVNDCTVTEKKIGICAEGGGTIRINGGRITAENMGIYAEQLDNEGKLCINGGKISGGSAGVEAVDSAVEITGGEITSPVEGISVNTYLTPNVLTISGGKFSGGQKGLFIGSKIRDDSRITGGTFTGGTASMDVYYERGYIPFLYSLVRGENGDSGCYFYAVDSNGNETQIPDEIIRQNTTGALSAADGYGTVTVRNADAEKTISVDVSWGALEYTYTDGTWNPETHTYEGGEWTVNRGGNCIIVKNTGSVDVNVSYSYESNQSHQDIFGSFADEDGNLIQSSAALCEWEEKRAYLTLAGRPQAKADFSNEELGTVTVTIEGK